MSSTDKQPHQHSNHHAKEHGGAGGEAESRDPLNEIRYREYKILLQPDRFTTPQAFHDFWKIVHHTAKKLDIKATEHKDAFESHIREVLFYDTPSFDLYNNSFILRKRTFYRNGWPEPDHELTIKFRHADLAKAGAVDVRPNLLCKHKVKFKEELLLARDKLGGMRSVFSHGCELVSPAIVLDQAVEDITGVFPALRAIDVHPKTKIELVNEVAVEEVHVDIGEFHFGHGYTAEITLAIWRNRASEKALSGEFSFQSKFENYRGINPAAKDLSEYFYKLTQLECHDWVKLGTTKTAMVYGLGPSSGSILRNHD